MKLAAALMLMLITGATFAQTKRGTTFAKLNKSYNPGNILHYSANIDSCKFNTTNPVTAYWKMQNGREQGTNRFERPLVPQVNFRGQDEVRFTLGAFKGIDSSILPNSEIVVRLENCQPVAFMEIDGHEVNVTEIYAKGRMNMLNLANPWKTHYVEIKGINQIGRPFKKRIDMEECDCQ